MSYDVAIVGGGLAGCSAAIQLAEQGRSVLLLEKERYPVHKLCGEFLSVEVQGPFKRLGVLDAVLAAGAHPIDHTRVTTVTGTTFESPLPGTALGLSRFRLDKLLFDRAVTAGADARDGTPVRNIAGTLDDGFHIETETDRLEARLVLGAYGKRSVLDRKLARPFLDQRSPFVAFKAHYKGVELPGTIELHSFPGGYCGLSGIEGGCVNVCWIAREETLKAAGGDPEAMIDQSLAQNPALARRFVQMERVSDRLIAGSQVTFVPKGAFSGDVCMIGDTAGMIAPMCGDGMAMALRGAELAVPLVARSLDDNETAAAFRERYARVWHNEFGLRMRLGRWMHHGYCHPTIARLGVAACHYLPPLGRWLIRHTRG
ncbi:MAG TPA: NAD(P)/FAD-dependent oxidoreductase [Rhodothermales bacterium]|nr:NAD(P)/FAD-dependent oxidoreductase [Rhodothermales bacterium]